MGVDTKSLVSSLLRARCASTWADVIDAIEREAVRYMLANSDDIFTHDSEYDAAAAGAMPSRNKPYIVIETLHNSRRRRCRAITHIAGARLQKAVALDDLGNSNDAFIVRVEHALLAHYNRVTDNTLHRWDLMSIAAAAACLHLNHD